MVLNNGPKRDYGAKLNTLANMLTCQLSRLHAKEHVNMLNHQQQRQPSPTTTAVRTPPSFAILRIHGDPQGDGSPKGRGPPRDKYCV